MDQAQKLRNLVKVNKDNDNNNKDIKIYTIASGKGGVGKTNVVVNTAITLQKKGKNVLIIDADLGLANIDVILGVSPKYTLYDVLFKDIDLNDALLRGPKGIKIIPGGSGVLEMTTLSVDKQEELAKEFLKLKDIDTILIDTGAGISKNLLSFVTFSQELIIVTTPEPTSLTDAYSVMKVISKYNLKKDIKIIINRVPNEKMAKSTFNTLKKTAKNFLNINLDNLGYILDDVRVMNSVMKQEPFVLGYPRCLASKCIYSITDKLLNGKKSLKKINSIQEVYNRLIKVFG
ncbi:MAG: MinD/ParA family protein [Firmicutes bacterium]|nr:MinD/ParA family protein [Bacillota bacterium]